LWHIAKPSSFSFRDIAAGELSEARAISIDRVRNGKLGPGSRGTSTWPDDGCAMGAPLTILRGFPAAALAIPEHMVSVSMQG
jgi:hypothetical protein